ncbi:MAG TPA: nucleotidyltransferase [Candidatus Limnocylindrales bacterium]|jgi:hypothetical protein
MVTTLEAQFREAHIRIGIERANAIKAHTEVRLKLETDAKLVEWGVDTILIGSYRRKTAIYPCHDVDVFVKLPRCPATLTPEEVFTEVQRVLVAAYGKDRATEQRRSMKITGFGGGLSVDVVPAVPDGTRWKIPQTDRSVTTRPVRKDRWETTNPEHLTVLSEAKQASSTVIDDQPSYLRTVRLVKQIRDTHVGDSKPGGLYFELLTYWSFDEGRKVDSFAERLALVLDGIATHLESGVVVTEPGMNQPYDPAPDPALVASAGSTFRQLATDAQRALAVDDCAAAVVWRRIIGRNDKAPSGCFPIPPGCSETGGRITPLVNKDRGVDGDRPFA